MCGEVPQNPWLVDVELCYRRFDRLKSELKVTASHWPYYMQFCIMATQNLFLIVQMGNQNFISASHTQSLIFNSGLNAVVSQ
jgi:hypothetical protein